MLVKTTTVVPEVDIKAFRLNFSDESMHSFHRSIVVSSALVLFLQYKELGNIHLHFHINAIVVTYFSSVTVIVMKGSLFFFSRSVMLMKMPIKSEHLH